MLDRSQNFVFVLGVLAMACGGGDDSGRQDAAVDIDAVARIDADNTDTRDADSPDATGPTTITLTHSTDPLTITMGKA